MEANLSSQSFDSAHVAWLVCLYGVTARVRREGLMSIEGDVENPQAPTSLFGRFPQVQQRPYLDFAADVLRMMVSGYGDPPDMTVYAEAYIAGLMKDERQQTDESLLRTIWLTLWASMKGYAPQTAIEFGRQGVPAALKPGGLELEDLVRKFKRATCDEHSRREGGLDGAVEQFIASLTKP